MSQPAAAPTDCGLSCSARACSRRAIDIEVRYREPMALLSMTDVGQYTGSTVNTGTIPIFLKNLLNTFLTSRRSVVADSIEMRQGSLFDFKESLIALSLLKAYLYALTRLSIYTNGVNMALHVFLTVTL